MYGYASPGAYPIEQSKDPPGPDYDLALKEWFYTFLKYIVGGTLTFDAGQITVGGNTADVAIELHYCGKNNRIHHNIFEKGGEGVFTLVCDNTQIYSNTFRHMSDSGVVSSSFLQEDYPLIPSGETVNGNWFGDVHQFMRYDRVNVADGVTTNFHYFLHNAGENAPNLGEIVQFNMRKDYPKPSAVGKFALTMAGNNFGPTGAVFHFGDGTVQQQGIPAATIADNSFLSTKTIAWGGLWVPPYGYSDFTTTAAMVGSFVNNRLVDDMKALPPEGATPVPPAWYGPGNMII
jgi:hypothetical protein